MRTDELGRLGEFKKIKITETKEFRFHTSKRGSTATVEEEANEAMKRLSVKAEQQKPKRIDPRARLAAAHDHSND